MILILDGIGGFLRDIPLHFAFEVLHSLCKLGRKSHLQFRRIRGVICCSLAGIGIAYEGYQHDLPGVARRRPNAALAEPQRRSPAEPNPLDFANPCLPPSRNNGTSWVVSPSGVLAEFYAYDGGFLSHCKKSRYFLRLPKMKASVTNISLGVHSQRLSHAKHQRVQYTCHSPSVRFW